MYNEYKRITGQGNSDYLFQYNTQDSSLTSEVNPLESIGCYSVTSSAILQFSKDVHLLLASI